MTVELSFSEMGEGTPLLVLHGLFGSGRNWQTIARRLAAHRRVLALDLRNHGNSPWLAGMSYDELADDVRRFMNDHGIEKADVIGHSMGGKTAMILALSYPSRIGRLVVVDIAPVSYPPALGSFIDAMRAVDLDRIDRRAEVDAALADQVPDPGIRAFLLQNLVAQDGRLRWRLNLAELADGMDDIAGFPAIPSGRAFQGPTLFVGGARSDYIRTSAHGTIRSLFPQATFATIPDAGHWVHAEQPERFIETVVPFLEPSR